MNFGFSLLWTLLFSTFACIVLQEASARVTIVSGQNLGQAIRKRFSRASVGILVMLLVLGAIILGNAAYEVGNILGSVAGASLGTKLPPKLLTLAIGITSGLLLYFGSIKVIAHFLGFIVALMGVAFLVTAFLLKPPIGALLKGTLLPTLPENSGLLVLGLIGTTVVPYNLFLGSGIAAGQKLPDLRFGLSIAIVLGGLISMGVLVVGTAITGTFSFQAISDALTAQLGEWSGLFFSLGLFAAGFSSAVTAPLAASITAQGLFDSEEKVRWHEKSWRYRSIWLGVLLSGVFFGLLDIRPIPVIILAQALNGILLPFIAVFLFLVVNDPVLMGKNQINHISSNIGMGLVVAVTIVLGVSNIARAIARALQLPLLDGSILLIVSGFVTVILAIPIIRSVLRSRRY